MQLPGTERGFTALLAKGVHPTLRAVIDARRPKSVLDIGAYSGEGLCLLHHWFPCLEHLEGWVTMSEARLMAAMRKEDAIRFPHARDRTLYER